MQAGSVFAGRFTIEREAGAGGMGTVYRALDAWTGSTVAVKVLHGDNAASIDRFEREALTLASLDHPTIVRYVAHGVAEGERWLAMEWLDGESLSDALRARRPTIGETTELGIRVASGLAVAHARGIVHRDLKPSNLFLVGGSFAQVKIVDYGIARFYEGDTVTTTGSALGTPGYMAPEQARGAKQIDARADVFSLGCVLYTCLTGRGPFAADDPFAAMLRLALDEPARPCELCDGIPQALDDLVARMLQKAAGNRPADGAAVRDALLAIQAQPGPMAVDAAPRSRVMVGATCLILVRASSPVSSEQPSELERREHDLRSEIERFGAELDFLPDRSMYVLVTGKEPPNQLAMRVARAALALDARLPRDCAMAMVTAWQLSEGTPERDAIEACIALLAPGPRAGIPLDEASASLLEAKFAIRRESGGPLLVGEGAMYSQPTSPPGAAADSSAMATAPATTTTAGTLAVRPRHVVAALVLVVGLVVVLVFVARRHVSAPTAAPGSSVAVQHNAPAATPAGTSAPPNAAPAPTSTTLSPDCQEYLRQLICMYRTTPRPQREKLIRHAREDLRVHDAAYCRWEMHFSHKTAQSMGCLR